MQNLLVQDIVFGILLVGALVLLYMMLTEMINFIQTKVPFIPSSKKDVEDMVKRVGITDKDFVIDLGSGNGKVLFIIEKLTGAKTRGLQRAGWTQEYGRLKKLLTGSSVELVSGDLFKLPWSDATVVYSYLYPPLMRAVGKKFKTDCNPGTKLVCRDFYIPDLTPQKEWQSPSNHTFYLYVA